MVTIKKALFFFGFFCFFFNGDGHDKKGAATRKNKEKNEYAMEMLTMKVPSQARKKKKKINKEKKKKYSGGKERDTLTRGGCGRCQGCYISRSLLRYE